MSAVTELHAILSEQPLELQIDVIRALDWLTSVTAFNTMARVV